MAKGGIICAEALDFVDSAPCFEDIIGHQKPVSFIHSTTTPNFVLQ